MVRKSASPRRIHALAPTATDASAQPNDEYEADAEQEHRPKRRGRPRKNLNSSKDAPPAETRPRKRGRPSLGEKADAPAGEGPPKKKRGRPPLSQKKANNAAQSYGTRGTPKNPPEDAEGQEEEAEQAQGRLPRGRLRPRKAAEAGQEQEEEKKPSKPTRKKKPRVSFQEEPEQDNTQQQPPKRGRGRPPLQDRPPSEAHGKAAKSGKPAKGKANRDADVPGRNRKRGRGRPSLESQQTAASRRQPGDAEDESQLQDTAGRRRSNQITQRNKVEAPRKAYPHVAPRIRGIKQSTVDAKWTPLTNPSIAAATETLTLAHRPIMQRLSSTQQRRQHTASALSLLQRRIARKLHRGLPFPPPAAAQGKGARRAGHEAELNFESVLDGAQTLERQLDPAVHSVELLRREKESMERELEKDYKTLRNLEAGARGQAREQREQLKKTHVLAPDAAIPRPKQEEAEVDFLFDHKGPVPPGTVFKDLDDDELKDLALQLGGHMDSIRSNLQQADGIVPQMAGSNAALRSVLLRYLEHEKYDEVLLG